MIDCIKKSFTWTLAIITTIFTFVPETLFSIVEWFPKDFFSQFKYLEEVSSSDVNIIISRLCTLLVVWIIVLLIIGCFRLIRNKVIIQGDNYQIQIEYGDILKVKNCKRVINFDECFSTHVGCAPSDIKSSSICGQYLLEKSDLDMEKLILQSGIKPAKAKSRYQGKKRYESGSIVPYDDDLLLAFAQLDDDGRGVFFTRDNYLECLKKLWNELDKYYCQKDVCIPILGAGLTRLDGNSGASLTQQELLDIIILSYKLCSHKIKMPYKLRIICKRTKGFSIYKIETR